MRHLVVLLFHAYLKRNSDINPHNDEICRNSNLGQFPQRRFSCRDRNGYITSGFPRKTVTSQMRCLNNNKKKLNKKNLPVPYGKADFNVSIEVTAEKFKEDTKRNLCL